MEGNFQQSKGRARSRECLVPVEAKLGFQKKKKSILSLRERAGREAETPIAIAYPQLRVSSGSVQFVVVIGGVVGDRENNYKQVERLRRVSRKK